MSVKVRGGKEIQARLRALSRGAPVATGFGVYEGLQEIMVDAKERAPKDTHAMAESGYVSAAHVSGSGKVTCEAGFGGPSQDYVNRQHFDTSLRHPNGGEAMFFQNALDAGEGDLERTIARHVRAYFVTGRTTPPGKKVPQGPWEARVAATDELKGGKHE